MAINDNDNYTLTGAQVKDLAQRVKAGGGGGGVLIGYINYTSATVPSGNISVYTDTTYTTAISADDVAAALDNGDTVFFKFTDGWDEIKILSIADSEVMIGDDTIVYHFMASSSKDCIGQIQGHVDDWGVASFLSSLKSVNNGTLTVQHNGTTVQTFSANQSASATANVETIYADPIASSAAITPLVQTSMIADGAVTTDKLGASAVATAKLADGAVTNAKLDWSNIVETVSVSSYITPASGYTFSDTFGYRIGKIVILSFAFQGTIVSGENVIGSCSNNFACDFFGAGRVARWQGGTDNTAITAMCIPGGNFRIYSPAANTQGMATVILVET